MAANYKKRNSWSKSGQSFVTFIGDKGKQSRQFAEMEQYNERLREEAAESEREARDDWKLFQKRNLNFGVDYNWLDKTFEHKGQTYRVAGLVVVSEEAVIVCRNGDRFARMRPEFVMSKLLEKGVQQ